MSRLDRLRWGTGVGAVVVVALGGAACGESFENACQKTHTCAPPNDGGSGEGGATSTPSETSGGDSGNDGGAALTEGGASSGAGGSSSADGGEPQTVPMVGLGDECETNGALSCSGPAQKLTLLCKDGVWTESTICKADENCDQSTGVCTPILEECAEKTGGELYCGANDTIYSCSPDLVSTEEVEKCVGKCVPSAASAACAPETCGDGKEQAPEECDDGNEVDTDECTNACTKAKCGDGATWKDHEQCDDGNLKSDDACTDKCVPATCGDGFIWAGKETCDDKNKVDNDSCTNACQKPACGNGVVQAGEEECDDKNVVSGDGCSSTCTVEPVQIVGLADRICALGANGQIRCFKSGTTSFEVTPIALPAGTKATALAGENENVCALLSGGQVRCWGSNKFGQLGLNDKISRDLSSPSSNAILGAGATATSIAVGFGHTCAVLAGGNTKCWGQNGDGELGVETTDINPSLGDDAGEMGDNLPTIAALDGVSQSVAAGSSTTCVTTVDKTAHCFGWGTQGVLTAGGYVNLGSTSTVRQLAISNGCYCAVLTDNSLKCWGGNGAGQLGQDDTKARRTPETMGDDLKPVNLGQGKLAQSVYMLGLSTLVILTDGSVKAWGDNYNGLLGRGDNVTSVGAKAGDMASLVPIALPAGRKAKQLGLGHDTYCALLDNGTIACWGLTPDGILGDGPSEMGSNLPVVTLRFSP